MGMAGAGTPACTANADEEHGHAVLDEELRQRRHAQEAEVMTDAVMSVI